MVGRTISHYEILAALGEGGMGVVYKARDLRLGRSVALKMLHPARSADPERKRRFVQEAKAVSALNHPNIVTIYDIGSEAGVDFIVMEHVVGKPLSQVIPQSGMRVTDALAVAIPIADALARAHNAGIVHRDLKPANLMLGTDGVPKLLDFGLAKLVERVGPADDVSVVATGEMTAPIEDGLILGTLSYMSPEQAEGRDVDARSDIFSFGAVLYEMVTGQPAFRGESPLSTLAAILHADPRPADEVAPGVPRPLGRLITRCLRKDPAKRWQSIADVRTSLEEIKQDSHSVEAGASAATRQSLLREHANVLWAVVASAAVIGIGAAAVWIRSTSQPEPAAEMLPPVPITTYAGSESSPSFSPDGSQFAFVWDGERQDNRDIYIKRFDSNPPLRLTRDSAEDDRPVWSPDGGSIAFVRRRLDVTGWKSEVVVVPSLGGPEHVLIDDDRVDSGTLDWSPDGKWLICGCPPAGEPEGLWVRSVENGEHHRLTLSKEFDREARFSPDGRSLAFVRGLSNSTDLYVLNLDASMRASGDPRRLTTDGLRHHSPQWLGNGRELVFTMGVFGAGSIGRIAAAGGRVRRVTTIDAPGGIAVSPRSNRLLISRSTSDLDIYRVELSPDGVAQTPAQSPVPVIASSQYDTDPVYSPNGEKIAFASLRSGEWQIWLCDKDGTNSIQLTRLKGGEVHPTSWRPADGRQIGFLHNGDGTMRAYMVAVGGGIPERVPELASVASPVESFWWSPNGSWVVYTTPDGVWKMPTKGDTPVKLGVGGGLPAFSGGGVLAIVGQESGVGTWHNVPLDGGASQPTGLTTRRTRPDSGDFRTSISRADGPQGLYVAGNPTPTSAGPILLLRWPNGPFSRITGADASGYGLSLSPNGRTLLYTRFASAGADLVLVENFK